MSWQQTADLRFVERMITVDQGPPAIGRTVKILQQRYVWRPRADVYIENPESEWRDVPLITADTGDGK